MANEITIVHQPHTDTLYSIIIRSSDRQVYDNAHSVFTAWNDLNLANYVIPLTNNVDDTYQADMPTIASGTYILNFYLQAGVSPSINDTVLRSFQFDWLASTIGIDPYALTDLATLKLELGITNTLSDTYLTQIINQASYVIEKLCDDRHFKARDYNEMVRLRRGRCIAYQYPILDIYSLGFTQKEVSRLNYVDNTNTMLSCTYRVQNEVPTDTPNIKFSFVDANGNETTSTYSLTTYKSIQTLQNAITTDYPNLSWTMSLNNQTNQLLSTRAVNILNQTASLYVIGNDIGVDFNQAENGIIGTGWSVIDEYCLLRYRAGYEVIPSDLQWLTTMLAKNIYTYQAKNTNIKSESTLGNYSYSLNNMASLIDEQMREILNMWCRKSIV